MSTRLIVVAVVAFLGFAIAVALLWRAIWLAMNRADEDAIAAVRDERTMDIATGLRRGDPYLRRHVGRHDIYPPEIVYPGNPHKRRRG